MAKFEIVIFFYIYRKIPKFMIVQILLYLQEDGQVNCSSDPFFIYRKMTKFIVILIFLYLQEGSEVNRSSDSFVFTGRWAS